MPGLHWRDLTDDELGDFDIASSADRIGDPEDTPDWYTLHVFKNMTGYGPAGGAIVHADEQSAAVWTTTSDAGLHAEWRALEEEYRDCPAGTARQCPDAAGTEPAGKRGAW